MKIARIETFPLPPRWLFVRVETDEGAVGWGEASLEGHTEAVVGAFEALKGISFDLMEGETIAVVGESGSGKSTLARILLRLDEPDAGTALWKGRDLFKLPPAELFALRRDLQMVFQDPTQSLNPRMTVFQLISEAWGIHPEILPRARWR